MGGGGVGGFQVGRETFGRGDVCCMLWSPDGKGKGRKEWNSDSGQASLGRGNAEPGRAKNR